MVPRTFPSTINSTTGRRQMVVFFLSSVTGLQRWKDYIPVKFVLDDTPTEGTYNNDGYIAIDELSSTSGKQSWLDYIPVFLDNSATDAWEVDSNGFIQVGTSGFGGVPNSLFASGEQGVWYDPSDTTTLFQDAAGTTPVTAIEQPVSLMLDKSKGLALGSELVTNGTFDTNTTGWTVLGTATFVAVAGQGVLTVTSGSFFAGQSFAVSSGKWYEVRANFVSKTAASVAFFRAGSSMIGGSEYFSVSPTVDGSSLVYRILATASTMYVSVGVNANGYSSTWDNITVKELAGNHAYTPAAATASRPVLSARYNLLTKTEQFDDAVWTKQGSTIQSGYADPFGGNKSWLLTCSAVTQSYVRTNAISFSGTVKQSIVAKLHPNSQLTEIVLSSETSPYPSRTFNFSSPSGEYDNLGNGWYRIYFSTNAVNSTYAAIGKRYFLGETNSLMVYVLYPDLQVANDGVGIPYQRVNTATDYDSGPSFPKYLRFDGSDDYMLTNSIDFTATDKMTVWAGVRKLSDAAAGLITELSNDASANNGSFSIVSSTIVGDASRRTWGSAIRGTAPQLVGGGGIYTAPDTKVFTSILDILPANAADEIKIRLNGSQVSLSYDVANAGTGNFGNYPLYIGRRGGTTAPLNGRINSLIVRGAASTDAQIQSTENYVNSKTKAY